jgi:hypothetical protein
MVGPPELVDPDDPVGIGEARTRIELRAATEAGKRRSAQHQADVLDDRRERAKAMARVLAD